MKKVQEIANEFESLHFEKVKTLINKVLDNKISPIVIIEKGIREGLNRVGKKFETGEYFLAELVMGADIMEESMKTLEPYLVSERSETMGEIIIGTVRGDIHNFGKDIFRALLISNGFTVHDIGVDVPSKTFLEKTKEIKPDILGLSCLISICIPELTEVVDTLHKAGLKDKVKIIIGGQATNEEYARKIDVAYGPDAIKGVDICKKWMMMKKTKLKN